MVIITLSKSKKASLRAEQEKNVYAMASVIGQIEPELVSLSVESGVPFKKLACLTMAKIAWESGWMTSEQYKRTKTAGLTIARSLLSRHPGFQLDEFSYDVNDKRFTTPKAHAWSSNEKLRPKSYWWTGRAFRFKGNDLCFCEMRDQSTAFLFSSIYLTHPRFSSGEKKHFEKHVLNHAALSAWKDSELVGPDTLTCLMNMQMWSHLNDAQYVTYLKRVLQCAHGINLITN